MDLTLISIVVGLGLTELLLKLYRLTKARRRVTWDAMPLAWALLILIAAVNYWFGTRAIFAVGSGWTTGLFLVAMVSPVFLFLACAAALPDVEGKQKLDMKAAYADERAVFLWFFLAYQGGNWLLDATDNGNLPTIVLIHRSMVCAALILALVGRSRRWDWIAVGIVVAAYAIRLVTQVAR